MLISWHGPHPRACCGGNECSRVCKREAISRSSGPIKQGAIMSSGSYKLGTSWDVFQILSRRLVGTAWGFARGQASLQIQLIDVTLISILHPTLILFTRDLFPSTLLQVPSFLIILTQVCCDSTLGPQQWLSVNVQSCRVVVASGPAA